MSAPFRRELPPHPDSAQQRTQAKELLKAFSAGSPEARQRIRDVLPDKEKVALADAQFVIAREYGFTSWSALKAHIDARVVDRRPPEQRLHEAFNRRDATAVRRLLTEHPGLRKRIDEPVFSFDAPAIVAFASDTEMVDVLLDFGADPNRRSDWWAGGFHALYSATPATAERLLAAGAIPDACAAAHLDRPELLTAMLAADPSVVHERGGDGQTPLHFARSRTVIDLLLAAGADIDARDRDHRSTAAEWMLDGRRDAGRFELAGYLVERGATADIFLVAALGLESEARRMLEADRKLLEQRTDRGIYGEQPPGSYHIYLWTLGDGLSPLDVAARFEQPGTLDVMLTFASPAQRLHFTCRRGDEEGAKELLRQHPAIVRSMGPADHRAVADAAWEGDARAVKLLLDLGFDPRAPGRDSGTALHCAAWQGSAEAVALILENPHAPELLEIRDTRHGSTPLGWCCHGSRFGPAGRNHEGVARLLLEAGARQGADTTVASAPVAAVLEASRDR